MLDEADDAHGVHDGDAFGDANDKLDAGEDGFNNGFGSERRGDENEGGVGTGLGDGFVHGVENGNGVVENLAAAAGGDACDEVGAVGFAGAGVETAFLTGDALNDEAGVLANQNAHGGPASGITLRTHGRRSGRPLLQTGIGRR